MTTNTEQLLREATVLSDVEVTHYATCCVSTEDAIRAAEQTILERALTQPAEAVGAVLVNKESREGVMFYSTDMLPDPTTIKDRFELVKVYTTPPASQEQAPSPTTTSGWIESAGNVTPKLDWSDADMQQPSGGEVKAAPVERYPAQDQAFHAFWYSHMLDDLMQPPLVGISHSTARYIWDSALATKPEPMTEEQIVAIAATPCAIPGSYVYSLVRAVEAHHGITAQAKKDGA